MLVTLDLPPLQAKVKRLVTGRDKNGSPSRPDRDSDRCSGSRNNTGCASEATVAAACSASARGFPAAKEASPLKHPLSASTPINPASCEGHPGIPKDSHATTSTTHVAEGMARLKALHASCALRLLPHSTPAPSSSEEYTRPRRSDEVPSRRSEGAPASGDWAAGPIDATRSQGPSRVASPGLCTASGSATRPDSGASLVRGGGGGGGGGSKGIKFSLYHRAGSNGTFSLPSKGRLSSGERPTNGSDASSTCCPAAEPDSRSSLLPTVGGGPSSDLLGGTLAATTSQQGAMVMPLAWSSSRLRADSSGLSGTAPGLEAFYNGISRQRPDSGLAPSRHTSSLLGTGGGSPRQSADLPPQCHPVIRHPTISASQIITQLLGGNDAPRSGGSSQEASSADTNVVASGAFGTLIASGGEGGSGIGERHPASGGGEPWQVTTGPLQAAVIRRGSSTYAPAKIEDLVIPAGDAMQRPHLRSGRRAVTRSASRPDMMAKMLAQPSDEVGRNGSRDKGSGISIGGFRA